MALLLHKCVCFTQTSRANAPVRWHFYFASLYVAIIHHAWVQLSDGTSTLQVCMLQSYTTRECSSMMALLLQKCVCCTHTSRVSATVRWHSYFKSVYVSNKHHAWVQPSYGSSNAHVYIFSNRHEAVRSFQMALQLHKAVIFKHKLRLSLAVRWGSYFTSVYVSNKQYAWEQMSDGTSTSQVRIFQTNITRECSSHMELLLHKCVCYTQTSRVSAVVRWHLYFTSVYV
jgi:hypothetical protein